MNISHVGSPMIGIRIPGWVTRQESRVSVWIIFLLCDGDAPWWLTYLFTHDTAACMTEQLSHSAAAESGLYLPTNVAKENAENQTHLGSYRSFPPSAAFWRYCVWYAKRALEKARNVQQANASTGLRSQWPPERFHPTQAQTFISHRARNQRWHWSLLGFKTVALCSQQCSITDMWREVSA